MPRRAWVRDAAGLAWVFLGAALVMLPLLRPGVSLGPFDLLTRAGLTHQAGVRVHNPIDEDQILQFVPWSTLAWRQVHAGHLPLWNPYNVLGTPLAFNWQSAVFSPPNLISYLFPVRYAYTVIVVVKLLVAGSGAYVMCRVLRLAPLPAAFAGVAFELAGPMVDRLGWAMTGVTMWTGWIFAAGWLLLRGRNRRRDGALLSVALALSVYGGHPQATLVLGVALVVFVVVGLVVGVAPPPRPRWRAVTDFLVVGVGAAALSAPLLLPALQLTAGSARGKGAGEGAYALSHLPNVLVAGIQGNNYRESAYVGVIAFVLALVGWRVGRWRRSVKAFAVTAVACAVLTFTPIDGAIQALPGGRETQWTWAVMPLAFALAVLGAFGLQALLDDEPDRRATVRTWTTAGFGACLVVVAALWVGGVTHVYPTVAHHLSSLVGPAADAAVGLVLVGWLWAGREPRGRWHRSPAVAAGALLALESAFLVASGVSFWSESSGFFTPTPAVAALQDAVGDQMVGLGKCDPVEFALPALVDLGISPNANIGYAVHEFTVYDPLVRRAYARSWYATSGRRVPAARFSYYGIFCPAVTTVSEARVFGVRYVLEPAGSAGPAGTRLVSDIGDERLFAVSGVAEATLVAPGPSSAGADPPVDAPGAPVSVSEPGPASWRLHVDSGSPALLRLRLTAVPGWHATIDGRPLSLRTWAQGAMLEARVPPGSHRVDVVYEPGLFTAGLVLAVAAVVVFVLAAIVLLLLRRRDA